MDDLSTPDSPSMPRGIYPIDNESGALRYWDGVAWAHDPVAPTWPRMWGYAIDAFVATGLFLLSFVVLVLPFAATTEPDSGAASAGASIAFGGAVLISFVGYFALSYKVGGRTLGMLLAGTSLVHIPTGDRRLPWGPAIIRALVLAAGLLACGLLWILWLILTSISRTRQGPHDLAAKTGVLTSRVSSATQKVAVPESPSTYETQDTESAPEPTVPMASAAAAELPAEEPAPTSTLPLGAPTQGSPSATIFISHASEDGPIAQSLAAALEAQGLKTWLASRDVSIGANYAAEIFQNLVSSDYLLVVLSPNSIESAHVRREVSIAIDRKVPVLPVSTDPTGELMANLPEDWQYWLNIAQVFRMTDEDSTAIEIARRVK